MALAAGIAFAMVFGSPWRGSAGFSKVLLQISVVGLGFGMNLPEVVRTSISALSYTAAGIIFTMAAGLLLGALLNTPKRTSILISFGTAICGGSAIAAMSPVVNAEAEDTGLALATVFTLNSIALILFPPIGHMIGMDQRQFGLWAAISIHDTSSVVGATSVYGAVALATGTTVKLARALWIIPSAALASLFTKSSAKTAFPYFILGFLAAAAIRSATPELAPLWSGVNGLARQSLVLTLFLIGSGITRGVLSKAGVRPLVQGVLLWTIVSVLSALAVLSNYVG